MNIFQEIGTLFKFKAFAQDVYKEIKMPTATGKPGWKTTEFYFNVAGQIAVLFGAVKGFIPANIATIMSVVGVAIYTVARTVSKAITDVQAAKVLGAGPTESLTVSASTK